MDLTRLLEMIFRRVLMRMLNRGIDAGINRAAGKPAKKSQQDMTPEERQQAKTAKDAQRRMRQAMKITRRF